MTVATLPPREDSAPTEVKKAAPRTAVRTSKNTAMLLAGTITRMIASFVFILVCADKMGVEGFGKYSIAIHYFELFLSLTATAAGILLTRDLARWPSHAKSLLSSAVVLVLLLWSATPVLMPVLSSVLGYSSDTGWAMMLATVALIPAAVCTVIEAVFVAKERAEFVTFGTAVESLGRISLSLLLLGLGYGLLPLIAVLAVVRTTMLVVYLVCLKRIGCWGFQWRRKHFLRFAMRWRVFAGENWLATIYTNLDIVVLSWIGGEVATGLYNAAWKIVRLGSVFAKSYTTAIFPIMSRMHANSKHTLVQLHRHTFRYMCVLALPAIAVIFMIPDRIIGLLFKSDFAEAAPILQVLIWVLLIEFLNPFLSHLLFAQGRQQKSMNVAAISLIVNSVATYLLVRQFGAVGAALGTVAGGLVATICYSYYAMTRSDLWACCQAGLRVSLAALDLAAFVLLMREMNLVALTLTSMGVYAGLLLLVGAVRVDDLRYLRTTFLSKAMP